jgi:hypothetical protein
MSIELVLGAVVGAAVSLLGALFVEPLLQERAGHCSSGFSAIERPDNVRRYPGSGPSSGAGKANNSIEPRSGRVY